MPSIDEIIAREVNPFDSTTFRPGNFWRETHDRATTVNSIHQEAIAEIGDVLDCVYRDNRTRTVLLSGDSGSGKSYLLGRLKSTLNSKAFFAYIGPWPESGYIWRHTLRHVVDSLMEIPAGQNESQLLLWLKSLSAFQEGGLMKKIIGERNLFIRNFKSTYPAGIYNANEFFGALYNLTQPELYQTTCEWLKGDDLDDLVLRTLRVKRSIDSEPMAQRILSNFGRIASRTYPIVLCFDNLDNIDRSQEGFVDLQALFNVNSMIHNQKLNNFLVTISIITNTWNLNGKRVQPADRARIDRFVRLQSIDLNQAETLWKSRLHPLHLQAKPSPNSPIYPLTRQSLEAKFPGGKALPRSVLMLGQKLFQAAKFEEVDADNLEPVTEFRRDDILAAFHLMWYKELTNVREKVDRIRSFSTLELVQMLKQVLEAIPLPDVRSKLLPSPTYGSYSLSFQLGSTSERVGVVWTEEPSLVSFCNLIKSCQKVVAEGDCQQLYLIRAETIGNPKNKGYQRYQVLFSQANCDRLIPDLESVHYLATYHNLTNAARSGELVLNDRIPDFLEFQSLVRESGVLRNCSLLQHLQVLGKESNEDEETEKRLDRDIEEYLFALVKTQQIVGRKVLVDRAAAQFPPAGRSHIDGILDSMNRDDRVKIIDPMASREAQLVGIVFP